MLKKLSLLISLMVLTACSSISDFNIIEEITAPDYVSSSRARKLEIPPDLSQIDTQSEYEVPGEGTSYKNYKNRQNAPQKIAVKVVEDPDGLKIIKSGAMRWLLVKKDPDTLWPHVQDFWEDMGFNVKIANKRTGVIETEWIKTSELKSNEGVASKLDAWLDNMSGFADRRKFRTRLELGSQSGTTEIFLSHRSSNSGSNEHKRILAERQSGYNPEGIYTIEAYKAEGETKDAKVKIDDDTKIDDYEINSEILRRLMVKLGSTDFEAKEKIQSPQKIIKAELVNSEEGYFVKMNDPYDRAWRRLALALDIIGFVTEDRNRSEGIFYVKYNNLELPSEEEVKEEGILDSLIFWDDDEDKSKDKSDDKTSDEKLSVPSPGAVYGKGENTEGKTYKETDFSMFDLWGSDDEESDSENRYRVKIVDMNGLTKVYLEHPDGSFNNSKQGSQVLRIIYEQVR